MSQSTQIMWKINQEVKKDMEFKKKKKNTIEEICKEVKRIIRLINSLMNIKRIWMREVCQGMRMKLS